MLSGFNSDFDRKEKDQQLFNCEEKEDKLLDEVKSMEECNDLNTVVEVDDREKSATEVQKLVSGISELNVSDMVPVNVVGSRLDNLSIGEETYTDLVHSDVSLNDMYLRQGAKPKGRHTSIYQIPRFNRNVYLIQSAQQRKNKHTSIYQIPRFNRKVVSGISSEQPVSQKLLQPYHEEMQTVISQRPVILEQKLYKRCRDHRKYQDKKLHKNTCSVEFIRQRYTQLAYVCYITRNVFCIDEAHKYTINDSLRDLLRVTPQHELVIHLVKLNLLSQFAAVLGFYYFSRFVLYNYELQYLDVYALDNILVNIIDIVNRDDRLDSCRNYLTSTLECYADWKVFEVHTAYSSKSIGFYVAVLQLLRHLIYVRQEVQCTVNRQLTNDIVDFVIINCCIQIGICYHNVIKFDDIVFDESGSEKFLVLLSEISYIFLNLYDIPQRFRSTPKDVCGISFSSALLNVCSQDIKRVITSKVSASEVKLQIICKSIVDNVCELGTMKVLQDIYVHMLQYDKQVTANSQRQCLTR
ncbi:DUF3514 domain-containing protein [Ehrlichia ruminantium]|uniref:DUF3514 domain-containing protein n=1 Tax=Ehrlichia ruminantium TaxID=779 RepID=A0AAE6Q9N0_EHRRU|nr:DUF3514 domain-containing protein [Ehrlichia ruminantium]QGR02158.1 DUF3514 domain-containing protein [Ehrlichia ruminantium]QGR03079.1 DUF3514 domain-containing protein [Ehrlichia ruminantium]QGR04004.1 DUF3514 domain-containing protein [Ehrlichia ruminantium]